MTRIDPNGIEFSVRHSGEYHSLVKTTVDAKEAYLDDNAHTLILEAGDDDSSATLLMDRTAAKRLNEKLTEVLQ